MSPDLLTPGARRRRRWPFWIGGLLLVLIAAGIAGYLAFIKAPGDVSHPDVEFRPPAPPKPPPLSKRDTGADWPLYGYDLGRTRYLAGVKLRPPFKRAWTVSGSKLIEFQPVLASGRLYFQKNNGELYSVSALSGRVRWRRRVEALSASAPAVAGGKVYAVANANGSGGIAGAGRARLVALDVRTGRTRWAKRLSAASESSPLAHAGRIYLGSQDGTVYAIDARTGRVYWRYRAGAAVKTGLAWSRGRVYFGDYGGRVTCLRARDGKVIWRSGTSGRSFGRAGNFYATPAVAFGRVYAGNTDGRVYSFAASSGKLAWSHNTGGYVYAAPAVAAVPGMKPAVFIGSYSGRFMALDARSGKVIWSKPAGGKVSGAASVIGDVVYYSSLSGRRTYALGARTGRKLWSLGRGAFNPAISDGRRVYITGYSTVYSFTTEKQLARDRKLTRQLRKRALEKHEQQKKSKKRRKKR
jgi:outer membrane protein assembly factor BamB